MVFIFRHGPEIILETESAGDVRTAINSQYLVPCETYTISMDVGWRDFWAYVTPENRDAIVTLLDAFIEKSKSDHQPQSMWG